VSLEDWQDCSKKIMSADLCEDKEILFDDYNKMLASNTQECLDFNKNIRSLVLLSDNDFFEACFHKN